MEKRPWYQWAHRWNQINLSETDPRDCDIAVWRRYWRENGIQGTILNAAGTVGYYPSESPYQYRARYLGGQDYFGELCKAAREEGLAVLARIDSNQAVDALYEARPEWFCRDRAGQPLRQTPGRYYTCINGGYYTEHLASLIEEIVRRYHPDAFADNTATGARGFICYCDNCRRKFKEDTGLELPQAVDFEDRTFRIWLRWNQRCRAERYAALNEVTTRYGGEDCIYIGMFKDAYSQGILERVMDEVDYAPFNKAIMVDGQIRMARSSFDNNTMQGLLLHEIFGEETLVLESVATYTLAPNMVRKSANTPGETECWMEAALQGGISPSTHFIGGVQEDQRALENGARIFRWERENEDYLYHRTPIANIGLVRSFANGCYYGREQTYGRVEMPQKGMLAALKRGRIPYRPLDARQIGEKSEDLRLLILPEIAVLSDRELADLERFVRAGGSVLYTGATGMLDDLGYPRERCPLDELFGIEREEREPIEPASSTGALDQLGDYSLHNYIRIAEPRHPIFRGFERTTILGLHSLPYHVRSKRLIDIAHRVPSFPTYPPEASFMEDGEHVTDEPAILAGETGFGGRVVYFAADYDRKYGETSFGDYGDLLKNAIVWALGGEERLPMTVEGPGELSCVLYAQQEGARLVLQLLNHSGLGRWPGSIEEFYPVGPERIFIRTDRTFRQAYARNLGRPLPFRQTEEGVLLLLETLCDQELIVIE